MERSQFNDHLKSEHRISPMTTYIKEFVYGGNDGIVTTFAVVAGFSGANLGDHALNFSILTVVLFGLANLFADGAAMGLGNYLSIRSEKKLYDNFYRHEMNEIHQSWPVEIEETHFLLKEQGFASEDAEAMTKIVAKNPKFWAKFMVQYECGLADPSDDSAFASGIATFTSFILFGAIPLVPYFFIAHVADAFFISTFFTVGALILLGSFRAFASKDSYWICMIETLLIGGTAASLAYVVGFLFKH